MRMRNLRKTEVVLNQRNKRRRQWYLLVPVPFKCGKRFSQLMRNWEGFAIRCALTFWNPFFAVGLPQTVYAFNDVHVFSINHVQDCCRIDAYKSRHYLTAALTKSTDSCGVHAYKSEYYFTSLKYLFGNFKFPQRNWPFCLTHPLAKSPKLVIRASFRKLLISPITNVFIKPFSA